MSRAHMLAAGLAVLAIASLLWRRTLTSGGNEIPFEPPSRLVEPAPLCPWRDSETDLRRVFPEANRHEMETRILSGLRVELSKQLGRLPAAEELALTLHRVYKDSQPLGAVLVRRVKGQHGAIEIVVAVTEQGRVRDVWFQRLREPSAIAVAVKDSEWLRTFQNRTHEEGWEINDLQSIRKEARISAQAIREGVRSSLVLLAASEVARAPSKINAPH